MSPQSDSLRSKLGFGLAGLCVIVLVVALILVWHYRRQIEELQPKASAFEKFCRLTSVSVQSDMFALRSSDPKRRDAAFKRIFNEQVNHGDLSARACLGDKMPSSESWDSCRITADLDCLAHRSEKLHRLLEEQAQKKQQ